MLLMLLRWLKLGLTMPTDGGAINCIGFTGTIPSLVRYS